MTTLTKTLLATATIGLITGGIIDFGNFNLVPAWTAVLPAGAIAFGMFLITLILEKEVANFDAEEANKLQQFVRVPSNHSRIPHDQ